MAAQDNYATSMRKRKERVREEFSENVKALLEARNIKQIELCKMVEKEFKRTNVLKDPEGPSNEFRTVTPWEMSRWVLGNNTPDPEAIAAIARVLDVTTDDLVIGISAEADPHAMICSEVELPDGRFFIEFKGTVDAEARRNIRAAITMAR